MNDMIDVNQLSNALQQKVDLPSGKSQADIDYVVEWKRPTASDQNWYRKYKSGWVEQGGLIYYSTQTFSTTIQFLKPFIDGNYCVTSGVVKNHGSSSDRWETGMCNILNMTGTSMDLYFYLDSRDNNETYIFWKAEGMGT